MIRVENKEIEFSTDKFTLITETLFLLDNLKEIADLDEEEVFDSMKSLASEYNMLFVGEKNMFRIKGLGYWYGVFEWDL